MTRSSAGRRIVAEAPPSPQEPPTENLDEADPENVVPVPLPLRARVDSPPLRPAPPRARAREKHARRGFIGSLLHAWAGLLHTVAQRNMKIHVVAAVLVGLVGSGVRLGLAEKVTLMFCVLLVFFAEILNTALEALVDLHTEDFRELARVTKDAAAAGVLVLASGTVVIFAAIVVHNWAEITASGEQIARQVAAGIPLAVIVALLLARRMRPAWVDTALFCTAAVLWALLWQWTVSSVFTTLTGSLVWVSFRAARRIHRRV